MKKIHFIAIGGSAMHNLALALHLKGLEVTGSDDEIFEPARGRLLKYNLLPEKEGWFPEKISKSLDAVILGMHAKSGNPELERARELGLKIFSYPEFLFEQSKTKTRIVVGGSHGKTTITGMILHAMQNAGIETDYMVGARLKGFDIMVKLSESAQYMVFEGDEYLTSPLDPRPKFHLYRPHIALISGIAWDHINVFPSFDNYLLQFELFIKLIEPGGSLVYCREDEVLHSLVAKNAGNQKTLPYEKPDYKVLQGRTQLLHDGREYPVNVFGRHNMLNISGAWAVCRLLGISDQDFLHSMATFEGASNRLENLGTEDGITLFKDFAHAPSKVQATVQAVRAQYPGHQLVAVLELHTYSSLNKDFLGEYSGSLDPANLGMVYFNPHALAMKGLPMIDNNDISNAFRRKDLSVFSDSARLLEHVKEIIQKPSVILFMSSGNFDGIDIAGLHRKLQLP